ncbi:DNA-binding protein WhiA [Granulicatella sp. zg-ZJ]|uniref:DNA-binding protein WhiA n=1 Tax=unclassified Granulicatella TaxID=2630493 RepID=UPI0013C09B0D|nr:MULTISPECIES: DNA-binding protein WhiA [unclassified Granulicatella]MBS4750213.1 DNA-binding protein WhiA [Carnobacteriaceae bacterium zg-ZUI78]NEW63349.1 DNA-binding protein WhiA [Granulicatella sp. zg-ZJ]NEW65691.1 DNA-binding protein WhiA [Granulicatella sp. zg-84]QMI85669.1 DNA-binding protein WhiA [Carnobacteriaceae bacterium zg-84]
MSYAAQVKKELTSLEVHKEHAKAELAALIQMNGAVSLYQQKFILNVQTENAAIARRMYTLLKDHYDVESELLVRRKMKLKKNNIYIVRLKTGTKEILTDLGIMDGLFFQTRVPKNIKNNEQKVKSYLRGAFLAGGSVNNPEKSSYHLEIYSNYEDHSQDICDMINRFYMNGRIIERRNGYIAYIKEAEKIADFLVLIGALNSMMKFEDIRIIRDMRNSVNRIVNCENANLSKVINASSKQIEAINYIAEKVGLDELPPKLKEVAELRLSYPESSLMEIGEMIVGETVSKSGINHRLRKIVAFADKLKKEGV